MRSKAPAGTLRTWRLIFHTSIAGRGLSLRYRSTTGSIRSKTRLSTTERSNFTYSAWAHIKRNRRARGLAKEHMLLGNVGRIPDLLGKQADAGGEGFSTARK